MIAESLLVKSTQVPQCCLSVKKNAGTGGMEISDKKLMDAHSWWTMITDPCEDFFQIKESSLFSWNIEINLFQVAKSVNSTQMWFFIVTFCWSSMSTCQTKVRVDSVELST